MRSENFHAVPATRLDQRWFGTDAAKHEQRVWLERHRGLAISMLQSTSRALDSRPRQRPFLRIVHGRVSRSVIVLIGHHATARLSFLIMPDRPPIELHETASFEAHLHVRLRIT